MSEEKRKVGFATLDREKVREIARRGGQAAQERGVGHRFTSEEAKIAGSKGGVRTAEKNKLVCQVHDAEDVVLGRICGRPLPCKDHGKI